MSRPEFLIGRAITMTLLMVAISLFWAAGLSIVPSCDPLEMDSPNDFREPVLNRLKTLRSVAFEIAWRMPVFRKTERWLLGIGSMYP